MRLSAVPLGHSAPEDKSFPSPSLSIDIDEGHDIEGEFSTPVASPTAHTAPAMASLRETESERTSLVDCECHFALSVSN